MKRLRLALAAACVSFVPAAGAEELRLKTRIIEPRPEDSTTGRVQAAESQPRRVAERRTHWLVQLDPFTADLAEWRLRGATVISSIPVNGYVVAVPDGMNWEGLAFTYRGPILATDKLSAPLRVEGLAIANLAAEEETQLTIVHFHSDVEAWEIEAILEAEGVAGTSLIRHAALADVDRLAGLTRNQIAALGLWDEVEFLYAAPAGMRAGEIFLSCGEALSGGYPVAMLAASYGEGWDGPGRGRASVTYSFGNISNRVAADQFKTEVRRAMDEWARVVAVSFAETATRTATKNLDIQFATGDHGDPYAFTSGTTVLAHSFYPAPPNPEPQAGDIHINDAWSWSVGGQWDLYSVVLHELGHSLGIGHTDDARSVMYPYYQKADGLKTADIDSIRQIYAEAGSTTPTPTASPLSINIVSPTEGVKISGESTNLSGGASNSGAGLKVDYLNETNAAKGSCLVNSTGSTWTCGAVPLSAGENRLTVQGSLGAVKSIARRTLTREANGDVQLTIASPASANASTTAAEIRVAGSASHAAGIASVRWSTSRGRAGVASGAETWSAQVTLETGTNEITITAMARSGIASTKKITVERTAASNPATPGTNPGEDKTPPIMTIQQPIGNYIITSSAKLTFKGTATDNVGVQKVTWTNSAGDQSGVAAANIASGVTNWMFDVNVAVGFNAIQVRAWDTAGNSTLYSTTVRRY